jgi:hypothetical protein
LTVIIDIAVGGIIYAVFSLLFINKDFDLWILGYSIFITLLPDLDGFLFLLFRKRFSLIHHKLIHWPIVIISLAVLLVYFLTRDYYWVCICIAGLVFHFIHDSLPPDPGPQWLFPFNTKHYCIDEGGKIVSRTRLEFIEFVRQFWARKGEKGPSMGGELREAVKTTRTGKVLLLLSVAINFALWMK